MYYDQIKIEPTVHRSNLFSTHVIKTFPFEKQKSVKFEEYKLFENQIGRLAEVMDKINARPQGRQKQQNKPSKLYIYIVRGHKNYPIYDRGYARNREHFRQR